MMNPHNIREHKYKNGWRIAILQQPRAIWGSNEELRRQHKDTCQCSCPGAARRETGGDRLQQRVWAGSPARGLQWETFRFHGIEETIIGIRCRKRHGCLNRKKHRNEKPFRRIKYKSYNIFYRFIRCWLNATFLFVYLDPENKKYLYSSIGLFRQRSENRLEVRYTNGKSRKTRRNKKNWTNKSRKWIKTLRLLSDGTKSCDF